VSTARANARHASALGRAAACTAPGGMRRNNRPRKSFRFRRAAVIVAAKAALIRGDAPLAELATAGSGQARHKRGQHK